MVSGSFVDHSDRFTLINAPDGKYAFGGVLLDRSLAGPYLLVIAGVIAGIAAVVIFARRRTSDT